MSTVKEEDYDPFKHRDVTKPITDFEAYIHLLKGIIGTGILALPQAYMNAGLVAGTIITIISGILVTHCNIIVVKVQNDQSRVLQVPLVSFAQAMKYALAKGPQFMRPIAPVSPIIIDVYLSLAQTGSCCIYALFVAVNIKEIVEKYLITLDARIWIVIILIPMIAINLPRNLKILGPFSQIGNVVMFIGMGIILYFVFVDLPGFENRRLAGNLGSYPKTFGTALYSLCPIALALALEREMKTPWHFGGICGMFNLGMLTITLLNIFIAFFGYLKYGDETLSSISLNIPQGNVLANVVRLMYAAVMFFSYPLHFYVPFEIIWCRYIKPKVVKHQLLYEYLFKISLIILTFVLAIAIPLLGLFISLVGAMLTCSMGIVFPAILEICHYWPDRLGTLKYILWKDIIITVIGVLVTISGTIYSIKDIIRGLQELMKKSNNIEKY